MFIYSQNEWCIGLICIEWDCYYSLILVELLTITVYKVKYEDTKGEIKTIDQSKNEKEVNGKKKDKDKSTNNEL